VSEPLAVGFARALRGAGLDVPPGSVVLFVEALGALGADRAYWAGRATLVRRPEDTPTFDRVFAEFWQGVTHVDAATLATPVTVGLDSGDDAPPGDADAPSGAPTVSVRYSAVEILRRKDFAAYTAAEFDEARRLMSDLRLAGALRRSRRMRPAARRGSRPDLRRTARRALRSGGEPVRQAFLEPSRAP
jgi:uncharacterized protein with von Willebrand factor type A (vWA) domain